MTHKAFQSTNQPPRLFAAVPVPDNIRAALHEIGRRLKDQVRFQKWTHPDDIHITLKFLGETPAARVDAVMDALRSAAADTALQPFELQAAALGVFGPPARPSILWTGLQGDKTSLIQLQSAVEGAMAALGYEREERGYRPHITLARRYNGSAGFDRKALETAEELLQSHSLRWTADSITLYRSHLGRTPMYEALAHFPLQAAALRSPLA
ncbi:RNA 2',3'-cyclic phosphodiesterase [Paenibacillus chartarius]|uniref:RNA 2',3'-cyclic phosphodiesterase n=1 Tax=Paenibacillus chartarius TaxID=747481 RepID=A0ABV6DK65_9BACL